jgi:signal transduction histidine kinase/PAS domain-containing protein
LQAEAKTAVAYSRLNHIMDSTSEGIFKIRFDWTILYGNRRAMEIIPNLCMERSYWDCFPAEKGTTSEHKLRTAMEQREQADWESYWETYKEWFAFHACPSEGGLSVFFVVITERKRVADQLAEELLLRKKREQDVEEANTRLNHVLDSTSEGILKVASNWTVVYCNVKGHEMLPDLAIGKDFWCCFPALKDSSAEQSLRAAMLDRSPVEYEIYYGPYAGWFRVNAFPTPGGISIFCTNITEHKRLEQELESERDRTLIQINSVMDSTSDCIVKLGPDWTILYGNRAAWQILPDLKLNTSYWDCFPAIAGTESEKNLRRTMEDRVETQWESFYEPYNEFYSVHAYPTQDGLSLFFVPITARKKLEQQVEKERMLRDSRIEALSNMAGGLAHEISNPLAIIHGTASDLQRMALHAEQLSAEEIRKASAAIVHTSDRAIRILRGLRGFAREGSKDPMEYASIYEILEQSLQMQEGRFARHHVELRSQVAADLPLIVCREVQIGQIVTNLLNNSFDAITQQNCPERWVRVDTILTNDAIEINVSDSGFGIDEEARKHLMEPFFTTKTRGLGMGVGLSLSRAIANEHG